MSPRVKDAIKTNEDQKIPPPPLRGGFLALFFGVSPKNKKFQKINFLAFMGGVGSIM
jgi:hypothetical protein